MRGEAEIHGHSTPHASPLTPHSPVGLLGGTFDPIHFGHLRLAEEMADALGLAQVRFLPAGTPPHRNAPRMPAAHRVEMTRRAIAGNPRFVLDTRDAERDGPCYTVDTLTSLRRELGDPCPLVLLLGTDAFLGLTTWHRWKELFDLAHLAVAHRPGFPAESWEDALAGPLLREFQARRTDDNAVLAGSPAGRVLVRPMTALDIAATTIRRHIAGGDSVRYLTPDAVIDYIRFHGLYR